MELQSDAAGSRRVSGVVGGKAIPRVDCELGCTETLLSYDFLAMMMMLLLLLTSFLRDKIFFQTNVHALSGVYFFLRLLLKPKRQRDIISALILSLSVGSLSDSLEEGVGSELDAVRYEEMLLIRANRTEPKKS